MSATTALPLDIIEAENEFAQACQYIKNDRSCGAAAEWMVWCTHTGGFGCPGSFYICSYHKARAEWAVSTWTGGTQCRICKGAPSPTDNLRFIKL